MNYFKFNSVLIVMLGILVCNSLQATEVVDSGTNSLDITADLVIPYNHLEGLPAYNYIRENDFGSNITFKFSNKQLASTKISAYIDLGINTIANNDESVMYNRYSYIEIINEGLGKIQLGKVKSAVHDYTVGLTNRNNIRTLDAGYSDTASNDIDGVNYATTALDKAVVYIQQKNNYITIFQFQSSSDDILARNDVECVGLNCTDSDTNVAFRRKYSVGAAINYQKDILTVGVGFERVGNTLNNSYYQDNVTAPRMNTDNIDSQSFLMGTALDFEQIYFGVSAGAYNNLKLAGINHLGFSSIVEFKLTKVVPYIGYELLYAYNIHNSIEENGGDLYGVEGNHNYSIDENYFMLGIYYIATPALSLGFEYDNDLRSDSQIENSLINNDDNKILTVYLKYSFK